eukprot:TRINITY_DN7284_c0_g1_i1.p1 TRINITY_DN7284_c0_g1~~TRINITY_DN7284_c0_g1_i1.p1  ORF type:complete len:342 (-),score=96.19 TRINITY_DN7284_c0_g1_i1:84-1067(-)
MDHSLTLSLFPHKEVVTIDVKDELSACFKKLFSQRILSAPVLEDGEVIGQLGVVDVAVFAVHLCKTAIEIFQALGLPVEKDPPVSFDDLPAILFNPESGTGEPELFGATPAKFIKNFSTRNPTKTYTSATPLAKLLVDFCFIKRAVVLEEGKVVNYITQTDVLKVLQEKNLLSSFSSKTIDELNLGTKEVITFDQKGPVMLAFKEFCVHKIESVPVVDEAKKVVGTISAYDIKTIDADTEAIENLFLDYKGYTKALSDEVKLPPVTLKGDATVEKLLETLLQNHIHHVFVVDDDDKLISVVSMTDLLRVIAKELALSEENISASGAV